MNEDYLLPITPRCEHCKRKLTVNATRPNKRFCNNRCRGMAWKMKHPELWEKMGTPRQVRQAEQAHAS